MSDRYRDTVARISLDKIYRNYKNVEKILETKKVIPVVKADAYGHGCIEVSKYLAEKGVDYFAVSLLEEGLELRKTLPNVEILCMGLVTGEGVKIAAENNITITICDVDQLVILTELNQKIKVHLKIDSGMNRLGFKTNDEIMDNFNILKNHKQIELEGIYTHFSTADVDKPYYDKQLHRFNQVLKMLNYDFKMIHISNSSSSIKYENTIDYTTHTRLGISLYGLTLDENMDFLEPAFSLETKISTIKKLVKGDKVGYGATYTAQADEIIGILPIGYADGFIRKNQGGDVSINGKRYEIIGRICMDQCFIKIDETITKDDTVILFGDIVTIDEVANRLDTINHEIVCDITSRVPREYIR